MTYRENSKKVKEWNIVSIFGKEKQNRSNLKLGFAQYKSVHEAHLKIAQYLFFRWQGLCL